MRHSQAGRTLLAAFAVWLCFTIGGVPAAQEQPHDFGAGTTADDAVRHGILASERIPRTIHEVRDRLQREFGGVLRTHIVANGGHGHATPSGVAFMCFETYEGPIPGGSVKQGELMFGFFLEPQGDTLSVGDGFIELIAWDRTKRVFNFWELEGSDWFYRGDSNDIAANVAALNLGHAPADFIFTKKADNKDVLRCSGCHTLGTPIMKEIEPPHNDWWRADRPLELGDLQPDAHVRTLLAGATDASNLAAQVRNGIDRLVAEQGVKGRTLPQLLRSLATTFEMNLASDTVPFDMRVKNGTAVEIPSAFFIDSRLIDRPSPLRVDLQRYQTALERLDTRFPPKSPTPARESHHAFLVPTPSYADTRIVGDLVSRGILDAELVADVLAVDMTTPVYSPIRSALVRFFPTSAVNADDLRRQLIETLKKAPAGDAGAGALLANLTDPKRTAAAHRRAAAKFLDTCQKAAPAAIDGWLRHAHAQRRAIDDAQTAQHPTGSITEEGFRHLFPTQRHAPRRMRLNPATCLAEPR